MLKVIGNKNCEQLDVELGDYVLLELQCHSKGLPIYWRTGNFETTLLEVKINADDGQVIGACLLLAGEVKKGLPVLRFPENSYGGLPVVCTDHWPDDRFLDEVKPFDVFVNEVCLLVMLSKQNAEKTFVAGNVTFGICANGSLSWLLVSDLDPDRLAGFAN